MILREWPGRRLRWRRHDVWKIPAAGKSCPRFPAVVPLMSGRRSAHWPCRVVYSMEESDHGGENTGAAGGCSR